MLQGKEAASECLPSDVMKLRYLRPLVSILITGCLSNICRLILIVMTAVSMSTLVCMGGAVTVCMTFGCAGGAVLVHTYGVMLGCTGSVVAMDAYSATFDGHMVLVAPELRVPKSGHALHEGYMLVTIVWVL